MGGWAGWAGAGWRVLGGRVGSGRAGPGGGKGPAREGGNVQVFWERRECVRNVANVSE